MLETLIAMCQIRKQANLNYSMILNRKTYEKLDRNNQYFSFIESCRKKQYSEGTTLHMHHIIPQYVFGKNPSIKDLAFRDSIHNVLSFEYIIAHDLLYQIYGNRPWSYSSLK